jgi:YD repeat-containing protein
VESQFHYDAQGSTLAVTDDDQNVTDTFAYTAFGEVTERTGTTEVPFQVSA